MQITHPVLRRELLVLLRSPRSFLLHFLFLGTISGVIVASWQDSDAFLMVTAEHGRVIYEHIASAIIILLCLLAPVLSASAISGERERRSLDLLLTTPMSVFGILAGKLFSSICFLILLTISSAPIFALCVLLGGIRPDSVLSMLALLISLTILCGVMGLFFSTMLARTHHALAATYAVMAPVTVGVLMVVPLTGFESLPTAVMVAVVCLGASLWIFLSTLIRFRIHAEAQGVPPDEEEREYQLGLTLNRDRFPDSLMTPPGTGRPIPEGINPVTEKELRFELLGRGSTLMRLLLQIGMLGALIFFISALVFQTCIPYGAFVLFSLSLMTPGFTANTYTLERERGTLDLLLSSPLTPDRILFGKLAMAARTMFVFSLFLGAGYPLLWLAFGISSKSAIVVDMNTIVGTLACIGGGSLLVSVIGMFFSFFCHSTFRSVILSYITIGVFCFLPVCAHQFAFRIFPSMDLRAWSWLTTVSPFFALAGLERRVEENGNVVASYMQYGFTDASSSQWIWFLIFSLVASGAMLWIMHMCQGRLYRLHDAK